MKKHLDQMAKLIPIMPVLFFYALLFSPIAEFSVSIYSTLKFICNSDGGVRRLLITEKDTSYKSNIYKNRIMWRSYQFEIEFITNTYLKVKGKQAYI